MKKIIISFIVFLFSISFTFAEQVGPDLNCIGLPGCDDQANSNIEDNVGLEFISAIIADAIQYAAVIAIISLMLAGMMYIVSFGEEEKTKKAKMWIIYSLVGVFLSISAFGIIQIVNSLQIS